MAVSRRLRYEVLRRDNHTCRYCGATAPDVKLTVDHVTPSALGGKDEASNLVTACAPCNAGKTSIAPDSPLVDDVAADAIRWARARQIALVDWRDGREELAYNLEEFQASWNRWQYDVNGGTKPVDLPTDWEDSVSRWLTEGLTPDDLRPLVDIAMRKPGVKLGERWKYFCGVVWRTLDDLQDKTKANLERLGSWTPQPAESTLPSDGEPFDPDSPMPPRGDCIECGLGEDYLNGMCKPCFDAHYDLEPF